MDKITSYIDKLSKEGENLIYLFEGTYDEIFHYNESEIDSIDFITKYQSWYSQAMMLVNEILPERYNEFNEMYFNGQHEEGYDLYKLMFYNIFQNSAMDLLPLLATQVGIIKSLKKISTERLRNIKIRLQYDIFDDEITAAEHLTDNKFYRASGVICGVVLERHLKQLLIAKEIEFESKDPLGILINKAQSNEVVSEEDIQHLKYLNKLRIKCAHDKPEAPTEGDSKLLISGTKNIIKST